MNTPVAEMDLGDYVAIIKRRFVHLFLPFIVIVAAAVTLAFVLPARYVSEATLLIERQTIPEDLVETTVTGYVQERIQQITQKILTYDNLMAVAETHDLYPSIRDKDPRETVNRLAEDFSVKMLDVKASDPNQVGERQATIAFTVSFEASTAEKARELTQEFADRYLSEHEEQRRLQTAEVLQFLEDEAVKLDGEIKTMQEELAEFKEENLNTLPELMNTNLRLFEKTEAEINDSRERIRGLEDRINTLNAELSVTPAYDDVETEEGGKLLNAQDRLNSLIAQYLRATSRYSPKHPDVRRFAREIRILTEQTGNARRADELMNELVDVQEQLRQAQQKYGPDHPDVLQLERSVASIQNGFKTALTTDAETAQKTKPNNPRYVALKAQLDATESSLSAERSKLANRERRLVEFENRLFETPQVESRYNDLNRDLTNAITKYNELKNKQIDSKLAQELEAGESGEKFSLTNPAFTPKLPESPNRIGIILLGILIGGAISLIVVAIAEYLDKAVYNSRTIINTLGAAPLTVIPRIA